MDASYYDSSSILDRFCSRTFSVFSDLVYLETQIVYFNFTGINIDYDYDVGIRAKRDQGKYKDGIGGLYYKGWVQWTTSYSMSPFVVVKR